MQKTVWQVLSRLASGIAKTAGHKSGDVNLAVTAPYWDVNGDYGHNGRYFYTGQTFHGPSKTDTNSALRKDEMASAPLEVVECAWP